MKNITTHLWFDKEAIEASKFYVSLFPDSQMTHSSTLKDTPSGDTDLVSFAILGRPFMAISAGPIFKFNPSISMFVTFTDEAEIDKVWTALIDGGEALMPYQTYPWSKKFGWLKDKYGLTWQLSLGDAPQMITPLLMFTEKNAGKAKEAMEFYEGIFPDSKTDMLMPYEKGEGDQEGFVKHARFTLGGTPFMAMDSSGPHQFTFNEAISLLVKCETQEEIDRYWNALSAVPEAEQCGWLKDKYGVSWQIVPTAMEELLASGDQAKIDRVTQAFLKMKKFDIEELERAAEG